MKKPGFSRRAVLQGSLKASVALASGAVFASPERAGAPPPEAITPKLIEAAKKEAKVVLYSAMDLPVGEKLGKAFEAKYPGIAVQIERSGSERLFQRIDQEFASSIHAEPSVALAGPATQSGSRFATAGPARRTAAPPYRQDETYFRERREALSHLHTFGERDLVVVTEDGQIVAQHEGIHRFTIGQRKGLGLRTSPTGAPMYVIALKPDERQVVVGPKASLERTTLTASGVNWIEGGPEGAVRAAVQIRHRHPAAPAIVRAVGDGRAEVVFDAPQIAITPGQAAVFYDGDTVLGGGWIE